MQPKFLLLLLGITTNVCHSFNQVLKLSKTRDKLIRMGLFDSALSSLNDKILMENAERLGRRESELIGKRHEIKPLTPIPLKTATEKRMSDGRLLTASILLRDGCVSIKNVLGPETADELLKFVNDEKISAEAEVASGAISYDRRFGAVNNRRNRADMFLPYDAHIVKKAVNEVVQNIRPFLESLDGMVETGVVHELSTIISDAGSPAQCVHCDTPHLPNVAPLYTFFIALQNVEDDMGHTTFLPRTHTADAHKIFNAGIKSKEELISISPPMHSCLKKGDTAIFDSRVLHCGGANTSAGKRRVLFYLTFTAGDTDKNNPNPSRGMGSIRDQDKFRLTVKDLLEASI